MVLIGFVWLAASFAVGYAGAQRGRGGVNWFLLALLLSPLLAVLVLLACPAVDSTEEDVDPQHGLLGLNQREEPQEASYWKSTGDDDAQAREDRLIARDALTRARMGLAP